MKNALIRENKLFFTSTEIIHKGEWALGCLLFKYRCIKIFFEFIGLNHLILYSSNLGLFRHSMTACKVYHSLRCIYSFFFKQYSWKKPTVTLRGFYFEKSPRSEWTEMNCFFKNGSLTSSHKISFCSTKGIKNDMPRASSVNLLTLE